MLKIVLKEETKVSRAIFDPIQYVGKKIVSNGSASHKLLMVVECENHQDDYLPRVEMPPNSFSCAWEGEHWLDWDL